MSRYYDALAAAFVRGHLGLPGGLPPEQVIQAGLEADLRLHKFKRDTRPLPRVQRVLGALRGLDPANLLDVGSGRGTFLWPLLDALPHLEVFAIDRRARRVEDLAAVRRGGVSRLRCARMRVEQLGFADHTFEGVTMLEVLEHLEDPLAAAQEILRVARRFALVSVPSKEDDNPEHIQLFDERSLTELFESAGAQRVRCDHILNHIIAFVSLG